MDMLTHGVLELGEVFLCTTQIIIREFRGRGFWGARPTRAIMNSFDQVRVLDPLGFAEQFAVALLHI